MWCVLNHAENERGINLCPFFVGCKCHLGGDIQRTYDPGTSTTPCLYPREVCATWCGVPLCPVKINSASRNLEAKMSKRCGAALSTLLLCPSCLRPSCSFPGRERSEALVTGGSLRLTGASCLYIDMFGLEKCLQNWIMESCTCWLHHIYFCLVCDSQLS